LTAEKTKLQTDLTTEQTAVHTSKSNFEKEITTFEKDELSYLQNLLTFETKVKKQSAIPASYGVTGLNGAISDQQKIISNPHSQRSADVAASMNSHAAGS
jgi:hypothetical protein